MVQFGCHVMDAKVRPNASLDTQASRTAPAAAAPRFARKLVTELHAGKSGLLRFRQAGLKRYLAAKLPHVVIGPANRIGSDPDRHCASLSSSAGAHASRSRRATFVTRVRLAHLGDQTPPAPPRPPGTSGVGGHERVGIDHHRFVLPGARAQGRFQTTPNPSTFSDTAPRLRVRREIDLRQGFMYRIAQQIVELAAGRELEAVDAAITPVIQHHDGELEPSMTEVAISEFIIRYEPSPTSTKTSREGCASLTPRAPAIS
jgi:hypothetical protein